MRRQEIIEGTEQVIEALKSSGLAEFISKRVNEPSEKSSLEENARLLKCLRIYNLLAQRFNKAGREVARILGLSKLEDTGLWIRLTGTRSHVLFSTYNDITFAINHLPKITQLLEQNNVKYFANGGDGEDTQLRKMRVLTVNVFEEENVLSSPARLSNVLESIDNFYTACALLEGESPSTLSVIACDSGSDKSFDFLGIAKAIDCVEKLITTLFERVFFFREHQFEERLDLVTKSLPIIHQINKMEEHKELPPEMAEILRRNIFDGANKFIQSGATIAKIEDKSQFDARSLLSPVQKLLVAAPDEERESAADIQSTEGAIKNSASEEAGDVTKLNKLSLNNLSDEEQEQLLKLLQKGRKPSSIASTSNVNESDEGDDYTIENDE